MPKKQPLPQIDINALMEAEKAMQHLLPQLRRPWEALEYLDEDVKIVGYRISDDGTNITVLGEDSSYGSSDWVGKTFPIGYLNLPGDEIQDLEEARVNAEEERLEAEWRERNEAERIRKAQAKEKRDKAAYVRLKAKFEGE